MGANTSMYTKHFSLPPPMRDYPWSVTPTDEQLALDIPLEVSLWGLLSIFIFFFIKIGPLGLAFGGDDFKFSMIAFNEENPNEVYKTDVTFYMVQGIAYTIKAVINTIVTIFALVFYSQRIQLYDDIILPKTDYTFWLDITMIILLPLSTLVQIYTGFMGVAAASEFSSKIAKDNNSVMVQQFIDIATFFTYIDPESDDYIVVLLSYLGQTFMGPMQVSVLNDLFLLIAFTASA